MTSTRVSLRFTRFAIAMAVAVAAVLPLRADVIELTNGDHYRGKVLGMDSNYVIFNSEIQGKVHLPRSKVAQITFVEVPPRVARSNSAAATAPVAAPGANAPMILSSPTAPTAGAPVVAAPSAAHATGATADDVIAQMRKEGVQPQLINQVQEQIFGKASPEASQKFEELMSGLMSGQISVQDLRKQAQSAIQQARDAKKDLGGDAGEMLDGYIGILEKFVNETAPSATTPAPVASAPVSAATVPTK
jgi:hypothetical protein